MHQHHALTRCHIFAGVHKNAVHHAIKGHADGAVFDINRNALALRGDFALLRFQGRALMAEHAHFLTRRTCICQLRFGGADIGGHCQHALCGGFKQGAGLVMALARAAAGADQLIGARIFCFSINAIRFRRRQRSLRGFQLGASRVFLAAGQAIHHGDARIKFCAAHRDIGQPRIQFLQGER